jgi:serine protease Do
MSLTRRTLWPVAAAVALAGGLYFGQLQWSHTALAQAASAKPTPTPQVEVVAPAQDLSRVFRAVHDSLKDAVVNINVTKREQAGTPAIPEELRGMLPPGFEDQFRNRVQQVEGTGSGVIVSADGYVLTNNHVVDGSDDITVTLNDGRELKAKRIGNDPKTDLAVIKINADHLTYAKFGDSDNAQVGDWVLAFGSPFGFSQTMTQGIISAKGRHVPIIAEHNPALRGMTYENFLQTDAAINPGNSGGPLVNLKGEVVGINAAIASSTGAYNGVGFSIPSNDAQYIMHSLIDHGKVVRGYLGIGIEDLAHPTAGSKGLVDSIHKAGYKSDNGVLVSQVSPSGPAAQAGVEPGDVITAINGKQVTDMDMLREQIARTKPDSKLNLSVFREGKPVNLTATVGTQPDTAQPIAQGNNPTRGQAAETGTLGVRVSTLDPATARRVGLNPGQGVIINNVQPDSLAADAGLEAGDVITKVNKSEVTSAQQFADSMKAAKLTDGVRLTVRTEDGMDRLVFVQKQ